MNRVRYGYAAAPSIMDYYEYNVRICLALLYPPQALVQSHRDGRLTVHAYLGSPRRPTECPLAAWRALDAPARPCIRSRIPGRRQVPQIQRDYQIPEFQQPWPTRWPTRWTVPLSARASAGRADGRVRLDGAVLPPHIRRAPVRPESFLPPCEPPVRLLWPELSPLSPPPPLTPYGNRTRINPGLPSRPQASWAGSETGIKPGSVGL